MIITIDGPAGSGKSSVAKQIAKKLGMYYLNTGLLYRAVAYLFFDLFKKTEQDLESLDDQSLYFINHITYTYIDKKPHIFYQDEDITEKLFEHSVGQRASIVSSRKKIRGKLLDIQRSVAQKYDIVAEGRDCGSVVFPNADYKFFLTASLEQRAKRVFSDKLRGDKGEGLEKVKVELEKRDKRDMEREVCPLIVPEGGIKIDNSDLNQEQTIEAFLGIWEREAPVF